MGNTRFIVELIRSYPDLIWKQDDKGKTIFHLAIKRWQEKIYNLLWFKIEKLNLVIKELIK
ncbi:hypothetical protein HanPI659440_Chr03g0100061 [Helianthus annuus]|nr:hypothetical protein HanPI659440_Chr03g0100061 [Helianthus annuus]